MWWRCEIIGNNMLQLRITCSLWLLTCFQVASMHLRLWYIILLQSHHYCIYFHAHHIAIHDSLSIPPHIMIKCSFENHWILCQAAVCLHQQSPQLTITHTIVLTLPSSHPPHSQPLSSPCPHLILTPLAHLISSPTYHLIGITSYVYLIYITGLQCLLCM